MIKKMVITIGISCLIIISTVFNTEYISAMTNKENTNNQIISPQYDYVFSASSFLSISSGTATIKGNVQKTSLGELISLTCTLQKKLNGSWINVKSWSASSSTTPSVYISEKYEVSKGEYRVAAYYSVKGMNGTESGTVYSATVIYN